MGYTWKKVALLEKRVKPLKNAAHLDKLRHPWKYEPYLKKYVKLFDTWQNARHLKKYAPLRKLRQTRKNVPQLEKCHT